MIQVLACALILSQPASGNTPPDHIQKYFQRCEEAKSAAIETVAREITVLEAIRDPTNEMQKKLQVARAELKRLREQPTFLAKLPLPPEKDSVGIFGPVDARLGRSVESLEVVDEDDVIIRAWYWTVAGDATFVDMWVHGIDTSRLVARTPTQLSQVFQMTGYKLFDTACGKRSMPLLEPIDLAPDRQPGEPPTGKTKKTESKSQ